MISRISEVRGFSKFLIFRAKQELVERYLDKRIFRFIDTKHVDVVFVGMVVIIFP